VSATDRCGLPLAGRRVLVTRAAHQVESFCKKLNQLGADTFSLPMTEIQPPSDWSDVDAALEQLEKFDWLVFSSVNAVNYFFNRATLRQKLQSLCARIAAIGPATAASVQQFGLQHAFSPSSYIAEDFIAEFANYEHNLSNKKILWARGNKGRMLIADDLRARGAEVDCITCYVNDLPLERDSLLRDLTSILLEAKLDAVLFASGEAAKNFAVLLNGMDDSSLNEREKAAVRSAIDECAIISIGPETSRSCRAHLNRVDREATIHTMDGMLQEVIDAVGHHPG